MEWFIPKMTRFKLPTIAGDFLDRTVEEGEPMSRAETKKVAEENHGRKCPNACPVTDYRRELKRRS
jgi:hypothetical protein